MVRLDVIFQSPSSCADRNFLPRLASNSGRLFLQIGAGVGNLDPRTNFQDGFTEFVKRITLNPNDRIILVEPNPGDVQVLKECWNDFECAEIISVAILPAGQPAKAMTLWFADEDAPYFQIASHDRSHVEHHYPQGTIRKMSVPSLPIDELILNVGNGLSLTFLGIDVEGLDSEILTSMDWETMNFDAISFESVHMGKNENNVRRILGDAGYVAAGVGLDRFGLDSLFLKPFNHWMRLQAKLWEVERQAHLPAVNGMPFESLKYLLNWFRTRKD